MGGNLSRWKILLCKSLLELIHERWRMSEVEREGFVQDVRSIGPLEGTDGVPGSPSPTLV